MSIAFAPEGGDINMSDILQGEDTSIHVGSAEDCAVDLSMDLERSDMGLQAPECVIAHIVSLSSDHSTQPLNEESTAETEELADNDDSTRSNLANIPAEIRLKIFHQSTILALGPKLSCPSLLLALAPSKNTNTMYEEAREVYRKINFVATTRNQGILYRMPMDRLEDIRCLTMIERIDGFFNVLSLRACKAFLRNNIEVINVDISGREQKSKFTKAEIEAQDRSPLLWGTAVDFLIVGSIPGISSICIVDRSIRRDAQEALAVLQNFAHISRRLGTGPVTEKGENQLVVRTWSVKKVLSGLHLVRNESTSGVYTSSEIEDN